MDDVMFIKGLGLSRIEELVMINRSNIVLR